MFSIGCFTIYLILGLIFLLPLMFARIITGAFVTLGFTPVQAFWLLIFSLIGGVINIPVKRWPGKHGKSNGYFLFPKIKKFPVYQYKILAVNVGGAIIPGVVSIWEIYRIFTEFAAYYPLAIPVFFITLVLNTIVCYKLARPVEGKGITLPALIPPTVAAVPSVVFAPQIAPVIAFPAGVLGVLIGADILHLRDIRKMNSPAGSIGGAGTFDGIFLCGIISVFLTG
ncbi:DUF1614 domain-containing protein [Elusimicrobiota bacterium]